MSLMELHFFIQIIQCECILFISLNVIPIYPDDLLYFVFKTSTSVSQFHHSIP